MLPLLRNLCRKIGAHLCRSVRQNDSGLVFGCAKNRGIGPPVHSYVFLLSRVYEVHSSCSVGWALHDMSLRAASHDL